MATKAQPIEKALVIVESPAKAKTIHKYLGDRFVVESSVGHIRDLPSTAAEVPDEYKNTKWKRLGVNVDEGFVPLYIVPNSKKAQVRKLKSHLKNASSLLLATDGDREGEAIAWHLTEVLKPKCPVKRLVFDEITPKAIQRAVEHPRQIDKQLVDAQETRRILDRLYGYEVSPVLWRKVRPKLSAGRVQSVATRLIVDRERVRMRFVSTEYWDVESTLQARESKNNGFESKLVEVDGRRVASGKDFQDDTGHLKSDSEAIHLDGGKAAAIADALDSAEFKVAAIIEKPFTHRPYAPFITSTLQQEAARKLRFSAQRTMRVAQSLYEAGYITYMRTDSTTLSDQAVQAARQQVEQLYGKDYLPDAPRRYTRKSKNAQEAHEAIRPAGETFRTPQDVAGDLALDDRRLYELIWKRTVASQMMDARGMRTRVHVQASAGDHGTVVFAASGKVIKFAGFLRAYVEGSDDPDMELEDKEKILPPLVEGQPLNATRIEPVGHNTQPPARYTEASLVKTLEERGIGRPSTYAAIIQTIQDRGYIFKRGSALVPTFTAFAVIRLLEQHLAHLVDYDFTARMEDVLDEIASGERPSVPWLHEFYFGAPAGATSDDRRTHGSVGLLELVGNGNSEIDAREVSSIRIGRSRSGEDVVVRVGRYGPYVQLGEGDRRASIPDDLPPDELTAEMAEELIEKASHGDKALGNDPETGKPVYAKSGRFGPYVQLGDPELTEKGTIKRGGKPKMASVWPTMALETLTLDDALMLLSYPREIGTHPETGEVITAQDGRFGPYIKMGTNSRSLSDHKQLATVTLAQAVEIFKQPKRGRQSQPAITAELGKHPDSDAPIQVRSGRFGPYVTDGVVNATIPRGTDPADIRLDRALELIAAREQKLRDQGKDPRAPKTRKKTAAKSTTKKKKATKKKTAGKKVANVDA